MDNSNLDDIFRTASQDGPKKGGWNSDGMDSGGMVSITGRIDITDRVNRLGLKDCSEGTKILRHSLDNLENLNE